MSLHNVEARSLGAFIQAQGTSLSRKRPEVKSKKPGAVPGFFGE